MNKQFLNFLNFFKIGVVKNFVTFTGKHLCWSLFLITLQVTKLAINIPEWCRRRSGVFIVNFEACNFIKRRLQHRCFPMKFEKFSRTPFLQNSSGGYFCIWFTSCQGIYSTMTSSKYYHASQLDHFSNTHK